MARAWKTENRLTGDPINLMTTTNTRVDLEQLEESLKTKDLDHKHIIALSWIEDLIAELKEARESQESMRKTLWKAAILDVGSMESAMGGCWPELDEVISEARSLVLPSPSKEGMKEGE